MACLTRVASTDALDWCPVAGILGVGTGSHPHPNRGPEHHRGWWPDRRGHQRTFAFPLIFGRFGQSYAYWVIVFLAVSGAIFTFLLVPETGRISLEEITESA